MILRVLGRRATLVAGAAAVAYWAPTITHPVGALRPLFGVEDRTSPGPHVALTFDDGPHPRGTPAVLERLAAAGSRAVFFLVGEQVVRERTLVREIVAAGHELGVHCYRHRPLMLTGPRATTDDLERAATAIAEVTGTEPTLYRPPYGLLTTPARTLARRRRWRIVLWRRWGRDWEARATPERITGLLTGNVEARDVLLLHDADHYSAPGSWERTAAALPRIFDELARRGLVTVTLGG